jgi:hypothetical protein
MARGGARKGAGRKPGAATRKTRVVADRAATEGITPLEVMLTAMRDCYRLGIGSRPGKRRDRFVAGAVSIAKDAAPYIHPKLSAVMLNATIDDPDVRDLSDADIERRIAELSGGKKSDAIH